MRQVTHALLTRPPLSHKTFQSEEIKVKCFARLACVKHAASVHPEPGSNSRIKNLGFVLWSLMFVYASHVLSEVSHELRTVKASSFVSSSKSTFWLILPFLLLFGLFKTVLWIFLLKKFSRVCCLLFNYQDSFFFAVLFKRQLLYFIKALFVCQELFYFSVSLRWSLPCLPQRQLI